MRFLIFFSCFFITLSLSASEIGVVFLHAKASRPEAPTISGLVAAMRKEGFEVVVPEMPWSGKRGYDASYMDAMNEIDDHVNKLKAMGAKSVFVAGHSLGANAAIGYGAYKGQFDGVIAIAPGHVPEITGYRRKLQGSPEKAAEMIAEGKGEEKSEFNDINQGKLSEVITTASIYHSYFSDNGPAVIPTNISKFKTALFWVVGENDRMASRGPEYAYASVPENPNNKYLEVSGGHKATPRIAQAQIIEWIKLVNKNR